MALPSFGEYLASLGPLTAHVDPTVRTPASTAILDGAASLEQLTLVDTASLAQWVASHPDWVPVLGLVVGLSQEKLKNSLRHQFDSQSWRVVAATDPRALVEFFDREFDLLRLLNAQRSHTFTFGDVLVARAGTRATAIRAGASGRGLEDEIEAIAVGLGLPYQTRTRFTGRNSRTAPCDLVIPNSTGAEIVVAAKGYDSTGSKLTDAVREIEEMAEVRLPRQVVIAVIDGIGWKSRQSDLKRIYELWASNQIDGMYSVATLSDFRTALAEAARLRGLG